MVKYAEVAVGKQVQLGGFWCPENVAISHCTGEVMYKCSGGSGGHIKVKVNEIVYTVHLRNIKSVL
jgi:hypothetical protein